MTPPVPLYVLRLTDPHWEDSTSLHRSRAEAWAVCEAVCQDHGYAYGYGVRDAEQALVDRGWTVEVVEMACPAWLRVVPHA